MAARSTPSETPEEWALDTHVAQGFLASVLCCGLRTASTDFSQLATCDLVMAGAPLAWLGKLERKTVQDSATA